MQNIKISTVDEYFQLIPEEVRPEMDALRSMLLRLVPDAEEGISYGMPCIKLNGILVYYACHKKHIGFYPTANVIKVLSKKLEGYATSKGAIQFPIGKAVPEELIAEIVQFRLNENKEKALQKKQPRKNQLKINFS
jgi:uncharacterized protein YdhG (YjbR/CyaY superfamily)